MTGNTPLAAQEKPQGREPSGHSSQITVKQAFFVCVHDVCPRFEPAVRKLFAALEPRIGDKMALAITPRFGGESFGAEQWGLVRETRCELLLHGLTHRRPTNFSPMSVVNGFADEWNGKSAKELEDELSEAGSLVRGIFGRSATGVTAPCWQWGAFGDGMLKRHKLDVAVGYNGAWNHRKHVALATQSWDWGAMSPAAPLLSRWARWTRANASPCIVLHPVDYERGHHRHGLQAIDRLLESGATVSRFGDVFAE